MNLSQQSQLTLYPLTIRQDKKHYIVEESLSGDFFEMPKICVDAINLINNGVSLDKIEEELKGTYPEDDVDLLDFVNQLLELELVEEIDGMPVKVTKKNQSPSGFGWISSRIGRFFFNKVTTKFFIAVICINILFFIMNPQLLPAYQDLFLFNSMMLNTLTYMGITLLLIIIHEFGHILAIRSFDLPAKLDVGNRLFLVVFETDLSPAWKLESMQRNILFLAGICFDQLSLFIALCLKLFYPEGDMLLSGIMGIVVFDITIKVIYQCCFYMKTDLYYLCENISGCYNLMENGKQYLSKWIPFIKTDNTTETFDKEEKFVRTYGLFYIFGVVLTFGLFVVYFIPQAFYAYSQVLPELLNPIGNPYFWDALVFLGQTILVVGLLVYSKVKNARLTS